MSQNITRWEIDAQIEAPCAAISFASLPDRTLRVTMHFSAVRGGLPDDLEIIFGQAYAMTWHNEFLHSVSVQWPKPLPQLSSGKWQGWTYPLLRIRGSEWLKRFDFMPQAKQLGHFALVAMNDIVEVVAGPAPAHRWLPPTGPDSPTGARS